MEDPYLRKKEGTESGRCFAFPTLRYTPATQSPHDSSSVVVSRHLKNAGTCKPVSEGEEEEV